LPGQIQGKIASYGESGNLVTDIASDRLDNVPRGQEVTVTCDEHQTVGIYPADHPEQPFTLMAILGASGFLELTIVGESAKAMLGVRVGETVTVKW
jgi:S-adenosylmethionine hydrolase